MNKINYIKIELKRNILLIPYLLIAIVTLSIVAGLVGFCALKLSEANKIKDKKNIFFSSEDNAAITKLAISALSTTESVTNLFNVNEIKYSEVESVAHKENSIVTVVVPKGFLKSLMSGDNYPIKLYFSSNTSIYTMLLTELTIAAQTSLQAAQSAVYTLYDYYYSTNKSSFADSANDELNNTLINKALSRNNFFEKKQLSSTGNFTIKTYYLASGILTVILLSGCIFILRIKNTSPYINLKLNQYNVGSFIQTLVNIFSIFITLYMIFVSFCVITIFVLIKIGKLSSFNLLPLLVNALLICLCCSSFTTFISVIMKNRFSSILLLFVSVITCEFISGAFLPSVFLPDKICDIDKFLHTTYLLNSIRHGLSGSYTIESTKYIILFTLLFTCITIVINQYRIKRFDIE